MKAIKIIIVLFVLFNTNIFCQDNNGWVQIFDKDDFNVRTFKIAPSDPSIIYVGGYLGIYRSDNYGENWEKIDSSESIEKISIDPSNPDIFYCVASTPIGHYTIKTTNGGTEWDRMFPVGAVNFPFIEIDRSSQNALYTYVYGGTGFIYGLFRSFDYGVTWDTLNTSDMPSSDDMLTSIAIDNDNPNLIYITSYYGNVYKSVNRGETWEQVSLENIDGIFIDPLNSEIVYAAYHQSYIDSFTILKSIDGGENWIESNNGLEKIGYQININMQINPNDTEEIYLLADSTSTYYSTIYHTINGGDSWNLLELNMPSDKIKVFEIDFSSEKSALTSFEDLSGIYLIDLTVTRVEEEKRDQLPNSFQLYQNYPNPFNPCTNIRYSIPKQTDVTLKIYDLLGREITTLVDTVQAPGEYSVEFNASNLSSGIYYYQLKTGSYIACKKLVLLR